MLHSLPLNGTWLAHWADGQRGTTKHAHAVGPIETSRYFEAQVPGEIHLDLLKAGVIGDFYRGLGHLQARWVEEHVWSYRREIDVPEEATRSAGAWIVLEGVEMFARVMLNGEEVAKHSNAFYPCRAEVTGKLKAGKNVLCVHLDPGLWGVADKKGEGLYRAEDEPLHKRFWTRRIQSQTSWDWSPRLMNCGIQGGAHLEWLAPETVLRCDRFVPIATLSDDHRTGSVRLRLFVENVSKVPLKALLTGMLPDQKITVKTEVTLQPGLHPVETMVSLASPELWWPVGHGGQPMYKAKVTLRTGEGETSELVFSESKFVGFRRVRVLREKPAGGEPGETFVFEVNGRPIFCKGGNFVPHDLIGAAMTAERYRKLVDLALEANFNFLRVWGGGQYESDLFYELCDRKGILVWQEFIFACMKYPVHDQAFYDDVMREARWNVRRLSHHPCLVAWCGNNEMEMFLWIGAGTDRGHVMPDQGLYHYALPRMLSEEDPTRHYQPSSPYSFDPMVHPSSDAHGDQHPWAIGFTDFDHRKYCEYICRFANEGGILGPTSLPTMRDCMQGSDGKIHNFHWKQHDNSVDGWNEPSVLDTATEFWLGKKLREMSLEEYTYWGGLMQGEGLREYVDAFRRKKFNSSAAIFWMFNDVWPATRSWTIVDWNLRRTPSFHPVRRAMATVSVVISVEGDEVVVHGISERERAMTAELRFGLFTLDGKYLVDESRGVTLSPNASVPLARFPKSLWTDATSQVAFATLSVEGEPVARNKLILPTWKELKWAAASITVKLEAGRAVFTSPTFVMGVCLDLDGGETPADNFFDLFPGQPYAIPWSGSTPPVVRYVGNLK